MLVLNGSLFRNTRLLSLTGRARYCSSAALRLVVGMTHPVTVMFYTPLIASQFRFYESSPRKPDEYFCRLLWQWWLLIAARPRGYRSLRYLGEYRTTLNLRERCTRSALPVRDKSSGCRISRDLFNTCTVKANNLFWVVTEWQSSMHSHSFDLPIATEHHPVL